MFRCHAVEGWRQVRDVVFVATEEKKRKKKSIALVESRDGIHWNKPMIVLGPNKESDWEDEINRPIVVKRIDTYHMWFTGQAKGHSWIGYATSDDGKTWMLMSDKPVPSRDLGRRSEEVSDVVFGRRAIRA